MIYPSLEIEKKLFECLQKISYCQVCAVCLDILYVQVGGSSISKRVYYHTKGKGTEMVGTLINKETGKVQSKHKPNIRGRAQNTRNHRTRTESKKQD